MGVDNYLNPWAGKMLILILGGLTASVSVLPGQRLKHTGPARHGL